MKLFDRLNDIMDSAEKFPMGDIFSVRANH